MIAHYPLLLAVRARALTVEVCTTGSTTLAATGSTYTRAAGSFLTDGFRVGMEVTPAGFSDTTRRVITALTATVMTVNGTPTAQAAASGRTLSVGMPQGFVAENTKYEPVTGTPYVVEQYLPGGLTKRGLGPLGFLEAQPTYVLQLWGPIETGAGALAALADALLEHFAPSTAITVGSDTATVRSDVAPSVSPRQFPATGWSVVTVSIPLRLFTANAI